MLSIEELSMKIDKKKLISDLSVTFLPGSITYIVGKNGSGKTSLLKTIAGLKKIQSGKISFFGEELDRICRPYCLYIGHNLGFEEDMKIIDQLEFWASSYNSTEMIEAAVHYWDLDEYIEDYPSSLSAGNKKKLALSRLTCCYSDLWLLDEVETNLDDNNLRFLQHAIISKANSGGTIIITTNSSDRIKQSQTIKLEDFL